MAVIASIDGPNRLIHLHADTQNADVDPMDIYKEMRTFRRTDEDLRKFDVFLQGSGYVAKGGGKFTPKLVTCLLGTRIVPYDATHELTITTEIITDTGESGIDCFDKTPLSVGVEIDINYVPQQVELIEIVGGSGLSQQEHDWIESIFGSTDKKLLTKALWLALKS